MKNIRKPFKIFLDTSVLLSGLNSPFGASGFILSLFKLKRIEVIISQEVITEAERVIKTKFLLLRTSFVDFLLSNPIIIEKLSVSDIRMAYKTLDTEDSPILAGAIKCKADILITLDKKFQKLAKDKIELKVLSPKEFLDLYRKIN